MARDGFEDMRPMVPGSIHGVRSFPVYSSGTLSSVSRRGHWRPGLNHAECKAIPNGTGGYLDTATRHHRVAGVNCTCGFWAYFDGTNDYAGFGTITGVVRGEGLVTVGSKGFRAERAEIVAIVDPHYKEEGSEGPAVEEERSRIEKFSHFLYNNDLFTSLFIGLSLALSMVFAMLAVDYHFLFWIPFAISIAGVPLIAYLFEAESLRLMQKNREDLLKKLEAISAGIPDSGISPEQMNAVRMMYPDVALYPTLEAALEDYPLSTPMLAEVDEDAAL